MLLEKGRDRIPDARQIVEGDGPRKNRCAIRGKSLAHAERAGGTRRHARTERACTTTRRPLARLRVTVSSQACYRVAPTFVTGPPPRKVSVMRSLVRTHKFS